MASKNNNRTSMLNSPVMKGADAFFRDDDDEIVEHENSNTVEQQDALPVGKQNGKEVRQLTSKTVRQQDDKEELVKVTYYITIEQDLKLDRVRLARRGKDRNKKIDKSALIREAIDAIEE